MNRTAKALLIPVAAFAVTMTGMTALSRDVLASAGLNDDQLSAFQTARDLRLQGDREAARDTLVGAGIDDRTIQAVRDAMQAYRGSHPDAIEMAVQNDDYAAFQAAIAGSPLADLITTQDEFARFGEAIRLRNAGDSATADDIFADLGLPQQAYTKFGTNLR